MRRRVIVVSRKKDFIVCHATPLFLARGFELAVVIKDNAVELQHFGFRMMEKGNQLAVLGGRVALDKDFNFANATNVKARKITE
jgi:hypothetical protein